MKSLRVKSKFLPKYLAWPSLAYLVYGAGFFAFQGVWFGCAEILVLIGVYLYLMSPFTTLEADSEIIRYSTGISCWEIKWSEVTRIETSSKGHMVLHGHNKRLTLPSSTMWAKEGKEQMLAFIQSQAQAWEIPQQQTLRASLQGCKNTRTALPKRSRPPLSS